MEKNNQSIIKESKFEKFFEVKKRGSNIRTEILAGVTTFLTMAYILMVNSQMISLTGPSYEAIYIATAIGAVIGTVCMGLIARLPLALASGMGLNAFFVYTVCFTFGLSYANALVLVLFDGIIFIILTVTGLRKKIFNAIPKVVRNSISAGIGLFIAFIGLQDAGIITGNSSTLVQLASLNFLGSATWASVMPIIVCFLGVVIICVLTKLKVKGAALIGILGAAVLYYSLGFTVPDFYTGFDFGSMNPLAAFGDWSHDAFLKVFTDGFNFSGFLSVSGNTVGELVLIVLTSILAFVMVDMFDTIGTLFGAADRGGLLTADGEVPNMDKAMLSDAIATATGAICGTSTVTTYVESTAGIAEGGKTGLTSLATAVCFLVAMFLAPIAKLIPSAATSSALIYVGILMMGSVKNIEWGDIAEALPAFITIVMMAFTYNISYGIGLGIITYVLVKLLTGKVKDINVLTVVIGILFSLTFFLTH